MNMYNGLFLVLNSHLASVGVAILKSAKTSKFAKFSYLKVNLQGAKSPLHAILANKGTPSVIFRLILFPQLSYM